jgi:DNA-binding NarL/FixJ family response regulator
MAVKVRKSDSPVKRFAASLRERRIGVVLVDGRGRKSVGLPSWLSEEEDRYRVLGHARNVEEALALAYAPGLEAMVVDMRRPEQVAEIARRVKARNRGIKIVARLARGDARAIRRVWAAGADAYVRQDAPPEALERAVRQAVQGGFYMNPSPPPSLGEKASGDESESARPSDGGDDAALLRMLSGRELCVLKLLGQNLRRRDIAERLGVSLRTVDTFRRRILAKAGLRTGTDLWRLAARVAARAEEAERRIEETVGGARDAQDE